MGYKLDLTFLLRPSSLTSIGLHALVLLYFSQSIFKTTIPSSGLPQVQRVSLKATPTQKQQPEKTQPRPQAQKTLAPKKVAPIPEQTTKPLQKEQETAQKPTYKADREHPEFAPTPHYPRVARLRGLEGEVVIKLAVDSQGVPVKTSLVRSSGYQMLDQAALEGLKRWRFGPTGDVSKTIAFTTQKTVKFQLQ